MAVKSDFPHQPKELSKELKDSLPKVYVDDLLMSLKYFVDEQKAHLWIKEPNQCADCTYKPCLYFCPVGVYALGPDGKIQVAYQACVECGSCRLGCPNKNIGWVLPRGGYGVAYKFG